LTPIWALSLRIDGAIIAEETLKWHKNAKFAVKGRCSDIESVMPII